MSREMGQHQRTARERADELRETVATWKQFKPPREPDVLEVPKNWGKGQN